CVLCELLLMMRPSRKTRLARLRPRTAVGGTSAAPTKEASIMARARTRSRLRARRSRMPESHPRPQRPPIVELRDATMVYPGGHVGLERVSISIDRGEFVFLVGPTGCGKSTFIKLLLRDLQPASGTVRVAGKDINDMSRSKVPQL